MRLSVPMPVIAPRRAGFAAGAAEPGVNGEGGVQRRQRGEAAIHAGIGAFTGLAGDHFRRLAEQPLELGEGPPAAEGGADQQIPPGGEGPRLQIRRERRGIDGEGNLAAGSDVDQCAVLHIGNRTEKAGLVVAEGGADRRPAVLPQDDEIRRHLREKGGIHPRLFNGFPVKLPFLQTKKAEAGGIGEMAEGAGSPRQPHGGVIVYGAEGNRTGRQVAATGVYIIGGSPEAGGHGIPRDAGQLLREAAPLPGGGVPAAVLPGIKRADGLSRPVQVQDAVHLPGDADAGGRAEGVEKGVHQPPRFRENTGGILDPFRRIPAGEKGVVGRGEGAQHLAVWASTAAAHREVVPMSRPMAVMGVPPYSAVDSRSSRLIISAWMAGERSRKFTKVPWIRMI